MNAARLLASAGIADMGKKPGLYANVNARKKAGKAPRKPGQKGYPTAKAWKQAAKTAKKK